MQVEGQRWDGGARAGEGVGEEGKVHKALDGGGVDAFWNSFLDVVGEFGADEMQERGQE